MKTILWEDIEMSEIEKIILAIDQGTTGSTCVLLDQFGRTLSRASAEFQQHFPRPGWVEHDPEQIWQSVLEAMNAALDQYPGARDRLVAIGITNQRETVLVWDRASRVPVGRALVWQDRRTSARCQELAGRDAEVRSTTGLVIDPYFSASKVAWLLEQEPSLRRAAEAKQVTFGTIDSFLLEKLGAVDQARGALIEVTNASRTMLMELRSRTWSRTMCDMWDIPEGMLPTIVSSAELYGHTSKVPGLPDGIPITGAAGDQHAALIGQGCVQPGDAKCTYGTGAFVLVNTGNRALGSSSGMLTTLGWQIGDQVTYALEGASFVAGAAVQWLRDGLGLIESAGEIEDLALQVESSDGVAFVPALTGLGAPYWDPDARGMICGITRGTTQAHIARATLEAIAFQVDDLLRAMNRDLASQTEGELKRLRVDGGASRNDLLMQIQANYSGLSVERPADIESTARGAGLLAAIGVGLHGSAEKALAAFELESSFSPTLSGEVVQSERRRWEQAVGRVRSAERS